MGQRTPEPIDALTIRQLDALRTHIMSCFHGSQDMPEPETKWASVRAELNRDGSLAAPPVVIDHSGGRYGEIVAQRALDAVTECAPYDFLPAELYGGEGGWDVMILNFGASGLP